MGRHLTVALIGLICSVGACAQESTVSCADNYVCPANLTCAPNGGCASTIQIASCEGQSDGASCNTGIGPGNCNNGICLSSQCGNGQVDDGELCDDGNNVSADGCRSDCRKVEICGDGEVDEGESCDDGNANTADGCDQCRATTWVAATQLSDDLPATSQTLANPSGVVLDEDGNLYLADRHNQRVRKVSPNGTITTFAGTGTKGFSGDGGVAAAANLNTPIGLALDGLGNLYIADTGNYRVRKVDVHGFITTVAGTGTAGYDPGHEGIAATSAHLHGTSGITVDGLGNLYLGDSTNHRVRKVDQEGIITTIAGTGVGGFNGDSIAATSANLNNPVGLAVDGEGNLYIADASNHRIRKVQPDGVITTLAGTGVGGFNGDGEATASQVNGPTNIAFAAGNIFVGDYGNNRVRKIALAQETIVTIAGTGATGFNGDNTAATNATLHQPSGVTVDEAGNVYIGDKQNQRIRKVDTSGVITTVAGSGTRTFDQNSSAATSATLYGALRVVVDDQGNLFVADTESHRVRKIDTDGVITTVAGNGVPGYRSSDDGGLAKEARLYRPHGVAVDSDGNVIIADTYNHRIRKVDVNGVITTVAGDGGQGCNLADDGGPGTNAALFRPFNVALDGLGNMYIASGQSCIRRLDQGGIITTIAGTGTRASSPDGPAAGATLNTSADVAVDSQNNVYVAETTARRIRKIDLDGNMTTVAGTGAAGYDADDEGVPATVAALSRPIGLTLDADDNLYIAEPDIHRIRKVGADGTIRTVAGNGAEGFDGDGLPATNATIWEPRSVAVDSAGNVFFTQGNRQAVINGEPFSESFVRRIDKASSLLSTVAGHVAPAGLGPFASARAADPRALATIGDDLLIAGGISGTVQRLWAQRQWIGAVAGRYLQALPSANLARFRGFDFGRVGGVAYDSTNKGHLPLGVEPKSHLQSGNRRTYRRHISRRSGLLDN